MVGLLIGIERILLVDAAYCSFIATPDVPKSMTIDRYIALMNKKLISQLLPTLRSNAIKDRNKSNLKPRESNTLYSSLDNKKGKTQNHNTFIDDPQDILSWNRKKEMM